MTTPEARIREQMIVEAAEDYISLLDVVPPPTAEQVRAALDRLRAAVTAP